MASYRGEAVDAQGGDEGKKTEYSSMRARHMTSELSAETTGRGVALLRPCSILGVWGEGDDGDDALY